MAQSDGLYQTDDVEISPRRERSGAFSAGPDHIAKMNGVNV
jgi:hypothetical protein